MLKNESVMKKGSGYAGLESKRLCHHNPLFYMKGHFRGKILETRDSVLYKSSILANGVDEYKARFWSLETAWRLPHNVYILTQYFSCYNCREILLD